MCVGARAAVRGAMWASMGLDEGCRRRRRRVGEDLEDRNHRIGDRRQFDGSVQVLGVHRVVRSFRLIGDCEIFALVGVGQLAAAKNRGSRGHDGGKTIEV